MRIELYIDNLVLDGTGLQTGHGPLLQQAVEAELRKLLAVGALQLPDAVGVAVPSMQPDAIRSPAVADPRRLGAQIAGALVSGLGALR